MYLFKEEDYINSIYFLESGEAAYVLPRYDDFEYITVQQGDNIGVLDIVFRRLAQQGDDEEDESKMRRKFTV